MSEPNLEEKFEHAMNFCDGAMSHLIKLKKQNEKLKEEKQELLDILTDLASMVETIEVDEYMTFADIWGEDYAQNVENVYQKSWETIQKYEEGENEKML